MKKHLPIIVMTFLVALCATSARAQITYEYDGLHRLIQVTYDDGATIYYEYDAVGNRTMRMTSGDAGMAYLATYVEPEGSGEIIRVPDQTWYDMGTLVELTAVSEGICVFVEWTGDVPIGHEYDNPLTLTLDQPVVSVTAHFDSPWGGMSSDCNANGIPDGCEGDDCNLNGVLDACDIWSGTSQDCNTNGIPDECDIADETSEDCNTNGIPDECELAPPVTLVWADFETGLPGEWTATGLWHVTDQCEIDGGCDPVQWAYFGQGSNCTFDTGGQAAGSLTAPEIEIPTEATSARLTYCSVYDGERGTAPSGYDSAWVSVNGTLVDDVGSTTSAVGAWEQRTVDLSAYIGQTITLSWEFDSIDGNNNDSLGWQVDAIEVVAEGTIDHDCNTNGIPDDCDILIEHGGYCDPGSGPCSTDYDSNGVPDECDPDCNTNGVPDACDINCATGNCASHPLGCGTSLDCQPNSIPDECDIASGTSDDYDLNGVPDECDPDCNTNGVPDACDLNCDTGNCASHPLGCGTSQDCQPNSIPDECDIASGTSDDYDLNGVPDECDPDCNANGVPDACDINCATGNCASHPLGCGTSLDCNATGVPDECETIAAGDFDADGDVDMDDFTFLVDCMAGPWEIPNPPVPECVAACLAAFDWDDDDDVDLADFAEFQVLFTGSGE
ncbi:MAG: RHS repeat protein [Phycisphaerae bacterium]|nr:RHS repeat protein [Phycisphaerae bacterium]